MKITIFFFIKHYNKSKNKIGAFNFLVKLTFFLLKLLTLRKKLKNILPCEKFLSETIFV